MKTCLIVIDSQESFRHRPYFTPATLPGYLSTQNALIAGAVAQGLPVIRIFHVDGPKTADNPFATESGLIRPIEGLVAFEPAVTFVKNRHSALVGTGINSVVFMVMVLPPERPHASSTAAPGLRASVHEAHPRQHP